MIDSFTGEFEFLSNFYPSPVSLDLYMYPTVEHAYQAAKTYDQLERRVIRNTQTPGMAKKAGRKCTLTSDWELRKDWVMYHLLKQKFLQELGDRLAATAEHQLIEGNTWHDNYWGNCYCGRWACRETGMNMLGK